MNRIVTFHGVDHKVGTTMTVQSVAERIAAANKNIRILLLSLQGREGTEYVRETPDTIESMKMYIDNRMVNGSDFLKTCTKRENLYMLGGVASSEQERYYYPDTAVYLMEAVSTEFELILADSGNELDNGLAVGALHQADQKFLILTQQETMLKRYEKLKPLYARMHYDFDRYLINKFSEEDPYDLGYIGVRLELELEQMDSLHLAGSWKQAEMDARSLLAYKEVQYAEDIRKIANEILRPAGLPEIEMQRKSRWRNFI